MKIAFYAPLKAPHHPVPSGDRLMARLLFAALEQSGHDLDLISDLRSFLPKPDADSYSGVEKQARAEIERISHQWRAGARPDLWFCYHPYYKAPDLLGPVLAARHEIPYVTAETSYSERRNIGDWARMQEHVLDGINLAAINICLTNRDRSGIALVAPKAQVTMLRPFIDATAFLRNAPQSNRIPQRMITVAMMRPGDKMRSYHLLADALACVSTKIPWSLSIVGDGAMNAEVVSLFTRFEPGQILWHGQATTLQIAELMSESAFYVWPGYGEAYGLAYLEAQAAGLPILAQNVAGVSEAVQDHLTGILVEADNPAAFAFGIERLLTNHRERETMGAAARQFVLGERTLEHAARRLDEILTGLLRKKP